MKSLPEIPDELANTEEYKTKGIVRKPKPIHYTNFGEDDQDDLLEEVVLDEAPSPKIKGKLITYSSSLEAKITNGFFEEKEGQKEEQKIVPPFYSNSRKIAQNIPEKDVPSMMDLLHEMEEDRKNLLDQENTHPNRNPDESPNNSFSSDDILDALEAKDEEIRTAADTEINTLENMNEEELKNEIESVLLPTINLDTNIALGPQSTNEERKEESKLTLAQRIQKLKLEDPC